MSNSPVALVREFHEAFELSIAAQPTTVDPDLAELRKRLLAEEVRELDEAVASGDLAAILHELADVVYVAYGTALTYGLDLDAAVAEVHGANMTKLGDDGRPVVRDGKVAKPPGFRPPNIAPLVDHTR
ncbi:MazG nucleotide pyrophosphohydrolase domain-containing protein [Actinopolymorpha sp. B17G11]|uniref:MazG nucleotide pyrophosphohydrolase domain-containing protein n=1 Tax=unclassified Actinopolymorpha TaxID=2627063 RepID=UPI0032D9008A